MTEENTDTPFNFAMLFYASLNELLNKKDAAAIDGDLWGWYYGLKAIKRRISFKIKNKEDKEFFKAEFSKVKKHLSANPPQQVAADFNALVRDEVMDILEDIDERLTGIMDKNSMIFPNIKGSKGLSDIRKMLNLDEKQGVEE